MKKHLLFAVLAIITLACTKEVNRISESGGGIVPGPSVNPVQNIELVCSSVKTGGPVSYSSNQNRIVTRYQDEIDTEAKRYFQFGEEWWSSEPKVTVTHTPAHVRTNFTTVGGAVYPDIWLEDEYDENGTDNYIEVSVTHGQTTRPYRLTLKRPWLEVETKYVYEKDSVLFRTGGDMVELPSANCAWILSYLPAYSFSKVAANTSIVITASDRWINFGNGLKFSVSANEGYDKRVGYVTVSDIYGENVHRLKVIQEGTGWQDRQNEVLWEFYNATGGPEWKNNNGWVAGMAATAPRAGIGFNDNGRVEQIVLGGNGLKGTLPESFGELWYVHKIDLSDNELSGPIPDCLGELHCVRELHLENNQLTGGIPESMKGLTRMSALYLGNNKLSGVIPDWIFELPRFVNPPYEGYHLCLGDNYFSNYDPSKHCTHAWTHEDGGNHGGKTPDGFNQGGEVHETF